MAGRLLLLKIADIQGDVKVQSFENQIVLHTVNFSATSVLNQESLTGSVMHSSVSGTVSFGPWVADIQQALFHGKLLGEVTITELEQQLDPANNKVYRKVREIKLTDSYFEAFSHSWKGITSDCKLTINFVNIVYNWGDKVSHFNSNEAAAT
jgi:hypothetical protein